MDKEVEKEKKEEREESDRVAAVIVQRIRGWGKRTNSRVQMKIQVPP